VTDDRAAYSTERTRTSRSAGDEIVGLWRLARAAHAALAATSHESKSHNNHFAPFGRHIKRMLFYTSQPTNSQSMDSFGYATGRRHQDHEAARL